MNRGLAVSVSATIASSSGGGTLWSSARAWPEGGDTAPRPVSSWVEGDVLFTRTSSFQGGLRRTEVIAAIPVDGGVGDGILYASIFNRNRDGPPVRYALKWQRDGTEIASCFPASALRGATGSGDGNDLSFAGTVLIALFILVALVFCCLGARLCLLWCKGGRKASRASSVARVHASPEPVQKYNVGGTPHGIGILCGSSNWKGPFMENTEEAPRSFGAAAWRPQDVAAWQQQLAPDVGLRG